MPSVLVTGAARGIGKSIVGAPGRPWLGRDRRGPQRAGRRRGHHAESAARLRRCSSTSPTPTDIAALQRVALPERLDAVVNNAGHRRRAVPMETVSTRRVAKAAGDQRDRPARRHPGGAARGCADRAAGSCSSPCVNGRLACRWSAPTARSKFALEAAADALRMELRPWQHSRRASWSPRRPTPTCGGPPTTWSNSRGALTPSTATLYARHIAGIKKMIPMSRKMAVPAEKGVRRRRGGADRPQAARPLRRRRRPQTAGGT